MARRGDHARIVVQQSIEPGTTPGAVAVSFHLSGELLSYSADVLECPYKRGISMKL